MARKKPDPAEEESAEVERHIDAMMDPKLPDPPESTPSPPGAPDVPEIDIFKDKPEAAVTSDDAVPTEPAETEQDSPDDEAEEPAVDIDDSDAEVDDIVAHEGDELLAVQDAEAGKADITPEQQTFGQRMRGFLAVWWDNKAARYITLSLLALMVLAAGIVPTSRYAVLSAVGVRSSASLTILDNTTSLPLRNVSVAIGPTTVKTDANGLAKFSGLRLGTQRMTINHLGFAPVSRTVTVGLGSNPLGNVALKAVGTQYTFLVTDYVSGKPLTSVEASSGEANAKADTNGKIILTVGALPSPQLDVILTADGYRDEKVTIDATTKATTNVAMVTDRKEVFVSNQSGHYDVYTVDVDGKNKQVLLAGTGTERPQMSLVPQANGDMVALVSSRNNVHDQDGYLLDTLTLINVKNGATLQLDQSEQIRIIDWIGDKLVYVKVKAGTSAGNAERYQLMSYDYVTTTRLQLAAANNFADIVSAKGVLYYATGNYYMPNQSQFVRINPDNTGKQVLLNNQVWNIIRADYNDLYLAGTYSGVTQNWYSYHIGDSSAKQLSQAPANVNSGRYYLDSPDGKQALWTEVRDGKGTLLAYDPATNKDTVLAAQSGLTSPLRWLDSRTVIYHVSTPQETADYVVSLDGGSPHKITDVTTVSGLGPWNPGY